jgi:hypothetical protein
MQNFQTSKFMFGRFIAAAGIYACFAGFLFLPHFKHFNKLQYFQPINICLGCLGCYLLSRRWVGSFIGSLFAGAVYGFGPYMLGLIQFHPLATLLAAAIPWLFCPAALMQNRRWHWLSVFLSTLPFVAIVLFFKATEHMRLYPIPISAKVHISDLVGLLAPLVMTGRSTALVGFYHVPVASLIMGISLLLAAQRKGIILIIVLGIAFALCAHQLKLFMEVSPVIWLTIPVLCCSVLVGEGMQGLALAGHSDRKWILAIIISMGILTIVTLLLATKYLYVFAGLGKGAARLLTDTAKLYLLGTLAVSVIFCMLHAQKRLAYLRWVILCSAMAVDIFLGARFIIDKIIL